MVSVDFWGSDSPFLTFKGSKTFMTKLCFIQLNNSSQWRFCDSNKQCKNMRLHSWSPACKYVIHCDVGFYCMKCRLHYGNCGREQTLSCGKNYFKWIQHTTCIHATSFLVSAWFMLTDSADTFSDEMFYNCFHFHVSTKYIIILSWSSIDHVRSCRSEADF